MKNILFTATVFIVIATVFTSCRNNDHDISISVQNNTNIYGFKAYYPENRTSDVQYYINKSIAPNNLFSSGHDYFDVDTKLDDGTRFHIKSAPGKMDITINKNENSQASLTRIEKIGEGIKHILTKK